MCTGMIYTCQITCLNGEINQSLLAQGVIKSEGVLEACKLACDAGTEMVGSSGFSPYLPVFPDPNTPVPWIWFLGALAMMCILVVFTLKDKL